MALKSLAIFFLTLLGLTQIFGVILQSPQIREFGRLTGAAPLAFVFSDMDGYEYWNTQMQLRISGPAGVTEISLDEKNYSKMDHGHFVQMAYAIPWALAVAPGINAWKQSLKYGFCNNGPLTKDFGITTPVFNVTLDLNYSFKGKTYQAQKQVFCE